MLFYSKIWQYNDRYDHNISVFLNFYVEIYIHLKALVLVWLCYFWSLNPLITPHGETVYSGVTVVTI